MNNATLKTYDPMPGMTLQMSFGQFVWGEGYNLTYPLDLYDAVGTKQGADEPTIGILSVHHQLNPLKFKQLVASPLNTKVLLLEADEFNFVRLNKQRNLLVQAGCGAFHRNEGWIFLPAELRLKTPDDLGLQMSGKWRKKGDILKKKCRECGQWRTEDEYYKRSGETKLDPYRSKCKICMRAASRLNS